MDYEDRLVLFVDILGFKKIIERSANDPAEVERVIMAIRRLNEIGSDELFESKQVTQFSDCLVLSYRVEERSSVFEMIAEVGYALVGLVEMGFLLRGGISVGKLLHTNELVFGPALVRAYELESKVAINPRVVVGSEVLEFARRFPAEHHRPHEEEEYVSQFLKRDSDNQQAIDYVSWEGVIEALGGDHLMYADYLGKVAKILDGGLKATDPGVKAKYEWLLARYDEEIERLEKIPDDRPFRLSNSELYDDLSDLPRFKR